MELRQYLTVIRRYLWLILLTTALATGAAFYASVTTPPTYQATATLEINLADSPLSDPYSVSNVRTVESAAEVFAAKIKFPLFLEEVKDRLGLAMDVQIEDMIGIQQIGSTQLVRIAVESDDPALAQALANTVVQVLIEQETNQQQASFQAGLAELETQINALEADIAATQAEIAALGDPDDALSEFVRLERTRLESQLTRDQTRLVVLLSSAEEFRLAMARYTDTITVYAPAELPASPVGSRTLQNTLLGAATGLMIGVGVAFLLEYLDDTIKSPADVKQILPVGVLGTLPRMDQWENGRAALVVTEHPLHPIAEAFRSLRTSIQFSGVDRPLRVLLVTSPLPTDGKTFTASNLAAVIAQGGQSVVVIDADLRHSTLHRAFDLPKEPGLTTALLSPDRWEQVLQATGVEGLRFIGAGARPPNPAELLASHRFREFLSWLQEEADVVIIDSPPVLAVTDAAVLSTLVDGVMLIADCGETRRPAAVQAAERLLSVGGNLLGVVINRMSSKGDGYYYYYSYYYSQDDDVGQSGGRLSWITRLLRLDRGRGNRGGRRRKQRGGEAGKNP